MNERQPVALPGHDTLARLANDAPQEFEDLRRELIENAINGAPEKIQRRLRQLQFRIDGIRRLSRSPLGAAIKIQKLMWESFLQLRDELQGAVTPTGPRLAEKPSARTVALARNAQLIEFPGPRPAGQR